MEQFYEQNVVNNNIDERIKKTKTLVIAKTVCWVLGLFVLISGATFWQLLWVFLLFSIPFFIAGFILGHINKRNNTEYDYVLDDEFLKISEIYFRERRKLKHKIRLRLVESVGVFDSEGYKKVERYANKKVLALVNYDDEQSIIYMFYNSDKGKRIIFLEPDRGFMIALRRIVPALTVFDKSIADFEKRLSDKEAEQLDINTDVIDDTEDDKEIVTPTNNEQTEAAKTEGVEDNDQ